MNSLMTTLQAPTTALYKYRWEIAKAAAIPLTVYAVCWINEYLLLDPHTNGFGIGCAAVINTIALTFFHYGIQYYWTHHWKDPLEGMKLNVQTKFKDYCKEIEALQRSMSRLKTFLYKEDTETEGKADKIVELRKNFDSLKEGADRLSAAKQQLIAAMMPKLLQVDALKQKAAEIRTSLLLPAAAVQNTIDTVNAELQTLKGKLFTIDAELKDRRALETELEQLEIQLQAAQTEQTANLRSRKTNADQLQQANAELAIKRKDLKAKEKLKKQFDPSLEKSAFVQAEQLLLASELAVNRYTTIGEAPDTTAELKEEAVFKLMPLQELYALKAAQMEIVSEADKANLRAVVTLKESTAPLIQQAEKKLLEMLESIQGWVYYLEKRKRLLPSERDEALKPKKAHAWSTPIPVSLAEQDKINAYFSEIIACVDRCLEFIPAELKTQPKKKKKFEKPFPKWGKDQSLSSNLAASTRLEFINRIKSNAETRIRTLLNPYSELSDFKMYFTEKTVIGIDNIDQLIEKLGFFEITLAYRWINIDIKPLEATKQTLRANLTQKQRAQQVLKKIVDHGDISIKEDRVRELSAIVISKKKEKEILYQLYQEKNKIYLGHNYDCTLATARISEVVSEVTALSSTDALDAKIRNGDGLIRTLTDKIGYAQQAIKIFGLLDDLDAIKRRQTEYASASDLAQAAEGVWSDAVRDGFKSTTELEANIETAREKKEADRKGLDTSYVQYDQSLIALEQQKLDQLRLLMYQNVIIKCQKAKALHNARISLLKDEAPSESRALSKTSLQKMRYQIAKQKIQIAWAKRHLNFTQHKIIPLDEVRLFLAYHRLYRLQLEEEWRVLEVGEVTGKRSKLIKAVEDEMTLVFQFFSAKIRCGNTPANCIDKAKLAIVVLVLDKIYLEVSRYTDDKTYLSSYDIIVKLDKYLKDAMSSEPAKPFLALLNELGKQEKSESGFFSSLWGVGSKEVTAISLITELTDILKRTVVGASTDSTLLSNFVSAVDRILKRLYPNKKVDPNNPLHETARWISLKLELIKLSLGKPFKTEPDLIKDFKLYLKKKKEFKKSKLEHKVTIESLEEKLISQKPKYALFQTKQVAGVEELFKHWATRAIEILNFERLSYILPSIFTIGIWVIAFKTNALYLSFEACGKILAISTATHLFFQSTFPRSVEVDEKVYG